MAIALTACSTVGPQGQVYGKDPRDPYESFNRSMYHFNDALDRAILRPVATGYDKVVPSLARRGVHNFFDNLSDVWSFVNNVLQFRGEAAMSSFFRVAVNTTFGLGGVFDVASEMRLQRYKTDFGLTLERWGVGSGPYLVLPFFGSSTVRDTVALPVNIYGNPIHHVSPDKDRYALYGLSVIDTRAHYLQASKLLDQIAFDPYIMTRDFYLSQRDAGQSGDGVPSGHATGEDSGYIPPVQEGNGTAPAADSAANQPGYIPPVPGDESSGSTAPAAGSPAHQPGYIPPVTDYENGAAAGQHSGHIPPARQDSAKTGGAAATVGPQASGQPGHVPAAGSQVEKSAGVSDDRSAALTQPGRRGMARPGHVRVLALDSGLLRPVGAVPSADGVTVESHRLEATLGRTTR